MKVVITGGSSGIGMSAAKLFLSRGHTVIVIDIKRPDYEVEFIKADVSIADQVIRAAKTIKQRHGKIDGLYHNAGILGQVCDTLHCYDSDFMRIINVNLLGTYYVDKYIGSLVSPGGAIVNQSSVLGIMPVKGKGAYNASKAAIIALTRTLALELSSINIRAVTICPGIVDTPMVRSDATMVGAEKFVPLGRIAAPEEIAELAYFIITTDKYMNGSCIVIDGGETAGFSI
ncbi:MAG: SDR family NAD(P)-dependent oxidoreductase [Nitrososphaeria archaeon]